jgi:hypothetical protein
MTWQPAIAVPKARTTNNFNNEQLALAGIYAISIKRGCRRT